ncbi:MAG: PilZ domain-containing protein [Clostridia bacterium]|nr:PilZ domain-containing protein [Clostridia bacterium]
MDIQKILKVGQLVTIEFYRERQEKTERYPTNVQDITDQGIYLTSPAKGGFIFRLPEGMTVKVFFSNQLAGYSFNAQVRRNENGTIPMLVLNHPEKVVKIQKREYVRVPYALDVQLSWTDSEQKEYALTCKSRDISAGGILLVVKKRLPLAKDNVVQLKFTVSGKEYQATGQIVKNEIERGSGGAFYTLGIKFTSLQENEKNSLVQSVFQRQIELKKKGLL